jgi:non-specific serine/threonine protein kinase
VTGTTIARYVVGPRIGAGGMGEVYRATDTQLHRQVALKFMAPSLLQDSAATRRFLQEARAASALDHANICTIYDTGQTDDGRLYLVMAYYEGETLSFRLRRGRLSVDEALETARQAAAGLDRAHRYGIVHRDVKPANLFITRFGEIKVLDFGLAKLRDEAAATDAGHVLGTVPYMSPEQASGAPVDHRSDIWSLGVVLFEMLAGLRPFGNDSSPRTVAAILYDDPPWDRLAGAPPAVVELLQHALEKAPEARISSCDVMRRVLAGQPASTVGAHAGPRRVVKPRCIIVMPFVSLDDDVESAHFGHGLADEITTALSRISALRVMARSVSERLPPAGPQRREVLHELGVEYIVEGAVRRHARLLRVSANLIDAHTGSLVWAEQFSGVLEDIFAIQERFSSEIANALRLHLKVPAKAGAAGLEDIESYDCYLRAKHEFVRYDPEGLRRALAFIDATRRRNGDNVLLLAAAGQIYWQLVNSGSSPDRGYLDQARQCAEQILRVDAEAPHGPRLMGMVQLLEGNIRETIRLLELAAGRDATDTDTLALLGACYGYIGRPQAGLPIVERLIQLDPLTPMYQSMPGYVWMMAGSFDKAIRPFAHSYRLDPGNPIVALSYGQCLALDERVDEALRVFDDLNRRSSGGFMARLGQIYAHALRKETDQALSWMTPELESIASWDLFHSWNLAQCHALLGNQDRALDWIERSVTRGMLNYPLLVSLDPFLASIRDAPRFQALMAGVRQEWQTLLEAPSTVALPFTELPRS